VGCAARLEQGTEDKENAFLINAVNLGNPRAATNLANRYYWGTHGLEQVRARGRLRLRMVAACSTPAASLR
jgi:hypothetical protein